MTDTEGAPVQSIAYDPFGRTVYTAGSENPAYQYTGQEMDSGTGLYYYKARYYDPVLGRFIQADTVLDGLNRYAYCGNNPVMYTDPTGHFLTFELGPDGLSIGLNFGIVGFGINIGWGRGEFSLGAYVEIGPHTGPLQLGVELGFNFGFGETGWNSYNRIGCGFDTGIGILGVSASIGYNISHRSVMGTNIYIGYDTGINGGWNFGFSFNFDNRCKYTGWNFGIGIFGADNGLSLYGGINFSSHNNISLSGGSSWTEYKGNAYILYNYVKNNLKDQAMLTSELSSIYDDIRSLEAMGYDVIVNKAATATDITNAFYDKKAAFIYLSGHGYSFGGIQTSKGNYFSPTKINSANVSSNLQTVILANCHQGNHLSTWQNQIGVGVEIIGWTNTTNTLETIFFNSHGFLDRQIHNLYYFIWNLR
jgi:RHS repeat-associated protein